MKRKQGMHKAWKMSLGARRDYFGSSHDDITSGQTLTEPPSQVAEKVGGKRPALLIVLKIRGGTQYTTSYSALLFDLEVWWYLVYYLILQSC